MNRRAPLLRRASTTHRPRRTRRGRAIAVVAAQLAALLALVLVVQQPASAGPKPVMSGFIPLPASQLATAFEEMRSGAGTTLDFTVGLTNAGAGAILTYDQWEDGYEADLANPSQSSTLVFGDGNTSNGNAATYCSVCAGDLLPQGAPLIMRNNVATPRPTSNPPIRFDGGDKVASTRGFAITAGGFTTTRGSLQASVASAYDTSRYGTAFTVPVGTNTPVPSGASNPFNYTSSFVQAATDGTVVRIDTDADGTVDVTSTIDQGEALHTRGLRQGATISTSAPVQVHLVTGDTTAQYESRTFPLFSDAVLSDTYLSPAGTGSTNFATNNFLYNPNASAITVTPTCTGCSGTIAVPAKSSATFTSPAGQAVRFASTGGQRFVAVAGVGAHSGSEGGTDRSSTWDWGFTMVPTSQLTSQIVLGWAPGNSTNPPASATDDLDDDPVWVTTLNATTLRVDLDGNPSTGSIATDDCFGHHDREISVAALASTRIFDSADGDMTGARIYTCDGTLVSAAWGEDPTTAPAGSPGFDAGYTVIPSTSMVVDKTSALADDADGDQRYSPGDTVTYSVSIADAGSLAFTNVELEDVLQAGMTYVPGSATFDDGSGAIPYADDSVPPATTAFPFDEGGGSIPMIEAGQTVVVSFDVTVDAPYLAPDGSLSNTACVTAQEAGGCDTQIDPLSQADLSLTKDLQGSPARVGDEATFLLTVRNDGPDSAGDVEVTDVLPAGVTYVSSDPSQGSYDHTTGLWTVGSLDVDDEATLAITVTVDQLTVTNYAEITRATAFDPDSQPGEGPLGPQSPPDQDDEDAVTVTVDPAAIDLHLDKALTDAGDHIGDHATFEITLTNDGPSNATGITVGDPLPAGLTYVSSNPSQGTYDPNTGTWTVGNLALDATATLEIVVTVDTSDPITNTAQVTAADQADVDSTPANDEPDEDDQASATVTVDPLIDLSLTKDLTTTPTYLGDHATFRITVTNDGPSDATDVTVTDRFDTDLIVVSSSDPGSFDATTGAWTVGDLAAGDSATLDVTMRVANLTAVNFAEVTAANEDDVDSQPAENALDAFNPPDQDDEDRSLVEVQASADLSLTKGQTGSPTHIGDDATFTILVRNDGPSDATGVEVTDLLPAGLTYVSSNPTQGTYDHTTGLWTVGSIDADATATLTITATVTVGSVTNFAEITDVDQHDPDSQPAENPLDAQSPPDQDDEDSAPVQVAPLIDLSVDKSVTAAGTHVGDDVTFRVAIDNEGPSDASGVVVGDLLPDGLTYVSSDPSQGTYDPTTGRWTVGSLAVGADATLDVTATVTVAQEVKNRAEVIEADQDDVDSTPANGDPDEDDLAEASIALAPLVDVSLTKQVVDAPTYIGDEATFRLTVANAGPSDATGVVVTDLLPAGLTFVSASSAAYDDQTGAWSVGDLEAGGSRELDVTVTVDRLSATNRAEVTATNEDDVDSQPAENPLDSANPPDQDDEDLAEVTVAPVADLSLAKTSTPGTVQQGDHATFRITVRNDGPSTATGVAVTDQLPAGVTYVGDDPSQGSYDPVSGIWTIGTLELDGEATLDIEVTVDDAGPIANTAEITGAGVHDPDSTPGNGDPAEDDQDTTVLSSEPLIDLSVTKAVSDATPNVGDEVTYTVTVSNGGPSDATGVVVEDQLPDGVTHVSHDTSIGTWQPGSGAWDVGELAVGETATLTIVVEVDDAATIANVAQVVDADQEDVDSQPAENPLDAATPPDQDDEALAVLTGQQIDLELDIAADRTVVGVGDQVTYTVTLTNQGPSDATGVAVSVPLPPGVAFVLSDPSMGSYDPGTGIWTVGPLAVGDTVTLELVTTVTDAGAITTIAQVSDADQPDIDSTPANDAPAEDDQDQVTITGEQVDLSLAKTISDDAPPLGGQVTYTLTVSNDGPSDATGVVVADPLPSGLAYVRHDGPGAYDPATGEWDLGDLASGASAELHIVVRVTAIGTTTNVAWVADVDQPDPDSSPSPDGPGDPSEDDQDQVDVTPIPASLTGFVWLDVDHDGTYDDGEPPIAGVTVQLLDAEGDVVAVTTTDEDGRYRFTDLLPGTYTVVIDPDTLPAEIAGQTFDPDSVKDGRFEVTLDAGQTVADVDFGYELAPEEEQAPVDPPPADPTSPVPPVEEHVEGDLPVTGSDLVGLAVIGLAMLGAGVVLLGGRRRRTSPAG